MTAWDDKPTPGQGLADWHRDAGARDAARLADGVDDDTETADSPWRDQAAPATVLGELARQQGNPVGVRGESAWATAEASTEGSAPQQAADAWNAEHPGGSVPVWYWPGDLAEAGRAGVAIGEATVMGGHTAVVKIDHVPGLIALTHVKPVSDDSAATARHESELADAENGRQIEAARKDLRQALASARGAVADVEAVLFQLAGPLYDVEYAEGGESVDDLKHFLRDAARTLRLAQIVNKAIMPAAAGA